MVQSATADTKQELDAARAKLEAIEDRLGANQQQLMALRTRASAIVAQINQIESVIALIQAELNTVQKEILAARKELLKTQAQLDRRARAAYESGGGLALEFILGSTSLRDLSSRMEIVDRATDSDRRLIKRVQRLKARLEHRQTKLEELEQQRLQERELVKAQYAALQEQLAAQTVVIAQINSDRRAAESLVRKLAEKHRREIARARRLARLAAQAQQSAAPTGPAIGGVLEICPVDQPRSYIDDWGFPRSGGRAHAGNDIFAPYGAPIRAPFPGNAVAGSGGLGGLSVKVYGSQGYVYNAHLSRLGTLGQVSTGTVIGFVGQSGNAAGTPPHNHFEWHPGNGGAVNPFPYLNAVC
ncbi:MAG: peptidoglycan DD-metalloendopeptidase family protein [Actinomycetota bacterium]|nr:peptidoglycan DD-metalloendopeptidase family protein [Actinomycetota bacterium]